MNKCCMSSRSPFPRTNPFDCVNWMCLKAPTLLCTLLCTILCLLSTASSSVSPSTLKKQIEVIGTVSQPSSIPAYSAAESSSFSSSLSSSSSSSSSSTSSPDVLLSPSTFASSCQHLHRSLNGFIICSSEDFSSAAAFISADEARTWFPLPFPQTFYQAAFANQPQARYILSPTAALTNQFWLIRRDFISTHQSYPAHSLWVLDTQALFINCTTETKPALEFIDMTTAFTEIDVRVTNLNNLPMDPYSYLFVQETATQSVISNPTRDQIVIPMSACPTPRFDINQCQTGILTSANAGQQFVWSNTATATTIGITWVAATTKPSSSRSTVSASSPSSLSNHTSTSTTDVVIRWDCFMNNGYTIYNCTVYACQNVSSSSWIPISFIDSNTAFGNWYFAQGTPYLLSSFDSIFLMRSTDYDFNGLEASIQLYGLTLRGWEIAQYLADPVATAPPTSSSAAVSWRNVTGPWIPSPQPRCAFKPTSLIESFARSPINGSDPLDILLSSNGVTIALMNDCGAVPNGVITCQTNHWRLGDTSLLDEWTCIPINSSTKSIFGRSYTVGLINHTALYASDSFIWYNADVYDQNSTNSHWSITNSIDVNLLSSFSNQGAPITQLAVSPQTNQTWVQTWQIFNENAPEHSVMFKDYHQPFANASFSYTSKFNINFWTLPVYYKPLDLYLATIKNLTTRQVQFVYSVDTVSWFSVLSQSEFIYSNVLLLQLVQDHTNLTTPPAVVMYSTTAFDQSDQFHIFLASNISFLHGELSMNWTSVPSSNYYLNKPLNGFIAFKNLQFVLSSPYVDPYSTRPELYSAQLLYHSPMNSNQQDTWSSIDLVALGCDVNQTSPGWPRMSQYSSNFILSASSTLLFLSCPALGTNGTAAKWLISNSSRQWYTPIIQQPTFANLSIIQSIHQLSARPLVSMIVYSAVFDVFYLAISDQVWVCDGQHLSWCDILFANPWHLPVLSLSLTSDGVIIGSFDAYVQYIPFQSTKRNPPPQVSSFIQLPAFCVFRRSSSPEESASKSTTVIIVLAVLIPISVIALLSVIFVRRRKNRAASQNKDTPLNVQYHEM